MVLDFVCYLPSVRRIHELSFREAVKYLDRRFRSDWTARLPRVRKPYPIAFAVDSSSVERRKASWTV